MMRLPMTTGVGHAADRLGRGGVADAEAHAHRDVTCWRMRGSMASDGCGVERAPARSRP